MGARAHRNKKKRISQSVFNAEQESPFLVLNIYATRGDFRLEAREAMDRVQAQIKRKYRQQAMLWHPDESG
eukprot:8727877-Karenia_brevis.AAC.1